MKGWEVAGTSPEIKALVEDVLTAEDMDGITEYAAGEAIRRLMEGDDQ